MGHTQWYEPNLLLSFYKTDDDGFLGSMQLSCAYMTWSLEWLLCNLARHDFDLSQHGNPFP
jgi:hypothetical protein